MVSNPKKLNKDHKMPMVLPDATSLLERSPPESDTVTMTSRCAVLFSTGLGTHPPPHFRASVWLTNAKFLTDSPEGNQDVVRM